jgi:hypothetical protein
MTRYNQRITLIVPAAKRETINNLMLRHGYGPDNLRQECIASNAKDDAKATHCVLECTADPGLVALVKNVLAKEANVVQRVTAKDVRVLDAELTKLSIKPKPQPKMDAVIDREVVR